ncbi:hypothetical protein FRC02_010877 [Tulasnella sp. 418]|nr:hypothetical protein FRC02_010877 [Tulasnella sp. 418]
MVAGESSRHAGSSMHPALKEPQGPIPRPSPHEITFTTPQTPVTDVFQSLASQGPRALAQVSPLQLPNKRVARKPAPTIPRAITRPDEFCQVISSSDFERHIVVREGKFLGKGGQGRVELAKSLTGEMLAIKFVYVDDGPQIDLCDLLRSEKDIFEKLQRGTTQACHQNIVGYRGMYWIEDEKAVAIVMEYIDGYCLDEIERLMKPKEVAALGVQVRLIFIRHTEDRQTECSPSF